MAPIFNPPSPVTSTCVNGKGLISTSAVGRSTFSFIRSMSVVPPATNFVPALHSLTRCRLAYGLDLRVAKRFHGSPLTIRRICGVLPGLRPQCRYRRRNGTDCHS